MASWTELTTTYSTYSEISLELWNQLSGYDGNLQYLYDALDKYSFDEYYAYGFNTTDFTVNVDNTYDLKTDTRVDERPDNVEAQFYDEDNYANIKIQKSGIYLINSHVLPVNNANQPTLQFRLAYQIEDNSISETKTVESNGESTSTKRLMTPNPVNYYSINRLDEETVVTPVIYAHDVNSSSGTIVNYTGSWIASTNPFAKTPYTSMLFLNTPSINYDIPNAFFYFAATTKYVVTSQNFFQTNKLISLDVIADEWHDAQDEQNIYLTNIASVTVSPITSAISGISGISGIDGVEGFYTYYTANTDTKWFLQSQANNKSYLYPYTDNVTTTSIANFSGAQILGNTSTNDFIANNGFNYSKNARYLIIGLNSSNITNNFTTGIEQNILSFIVKNDYESTYIPAKPVTLSATTDGTYLTLWLRVYNRVHQIEFSDLELGEIFIGFEFFQIYNNQNLYAPKIFINNKLIVEDSGSNEEFIDLVNNIYVTNTQNFLPSYDVQRVTGIDIQGNDFFSVSNNWSGLSSHSSYYFIGNWFFDDEFAENQNMELQKEFIWQYLSEYYEVPLIDYNYTVTSTTVSNAIVFDQFQFGDNDRFI